ncbi:TetR/AcrR family transcriptional regulator [Amycolatopsis sp. NPDC051758]|uniref:TetR/AcrR family transcriptional regulator n=1 Tax=Amycolatopsis sp. NPDC051758 TaxID=3363935 RepID=UPI00379C1941
METAEPRARRRDAAATREALLAAARTLLAEHGVEGTSTRDVAAAAGVNQALVYRYFGSKEKLFAEAAGRGLEAADSMTVETPLANLPRALLDRALDVGADHPSHLSGLVTAANDDMIRAVVRERIERAFDEQLAPRLTGADRELRAELLAAVITGIAVLRGKVGTRALTAADRDTIGEYVDRIAAVLLTGR